MLPAKQSNRTTGQVTASATIRFLPAEPVRNWVKGTILMASLPPANFRALFSPDLDKDDAVDDVECVEYTGDRRSLDLSRKDDTLHFNHYDNVYFAVKERR